MKQTPLVRRFVLALSVAAALTVPVATQAHAAPHPKEGSDCIGADTGRKATSPRGVPLVCSDFTWQRDRGQKPRHHLDDNRTR